MRYLELRLGKLKMSKLERKPCFYHRYLHSTSQLSDDTRNRMQTPRIKLTTLLTTYLGKPPRTRFYMNVLQISHSTSCSLSRRRSVECQQPLTVLCLCYNICVSCCITNGEKEYALPVCVCLPEDRKM
jgi:hypothetical protein